MAATGVVGRRSDIAEIVDVLRIDREVGGPRLVVVTGEAGVGKTTVAVHAAHRLAHAFPDGQLFVDLGDRAEADGSDLDDVLSFFLRALGVPPESLPTRRADAVGLYRSLTAGRRVLVVLDGAKSVSQVRSLLPGSPTCAVLVTSRDGLPDLLLAPGGRRLALGLLSPGDARNLLRTAIGDQRVQAEEAAARGLVSRCRGLPHAVRSAAVHLAAATDRTIASYLDELERAGSISVLSPDRRRVSAG